MGFIYVCPNCNNNIELSVKSSKNNVNIDRFVFICPECGNAYQINATLIYTSEKSKKKNFSFDDVNFPNDDLQGAGNDIEDNEYSTE